MTYSDNIRKLIGKQAKQDRKLDRLKVVEKSARTDDIIRKQIDELGNEYVEIGLNLVDHSQLIPNGSFDDGEDHWDIELKGDPGTGSWSYSAGGGLLTVGGQPIEGCSIAVDNIEQIYMRAIGKIHEYHLLYMNIDYSNSTYIKWTITVTEYDVDGNVVYTNSVAPGSSPLPGVLLDLYHHFTPGDETAYVKFTMLGEVPAGVKTPTSMQSTIYAVSVRAPGSGGTAIETNFTKTTVKSIETVLEGTLAAQNISTTPSNDYIPQADGAGKLDVGWMPSTIDADKLDGNHASAFATSGHGHEHDTLSGLADDDHTQYTKGAGTVTDNAIVRFDGTNGRTIQNSGVLIDDSNNVTFPGDITYNSKVLGAWQSWTPTQTGWTALPTGIYNYMLVGKTCYVNIYISAGTSNATTATLSLPFTASSATNMWGVCGRSMDNGVTLTAPSIWNVNGGATSVQFGKAYGAVGGWTASGTKRIDCQFFYIIA